jgi:hypothetical protein
MIRKSKEERKARLQQKTAGGFSGPSIFALDFQQFEGVDSFKPEEGYNEFDIVPYIIQDEKHPGGKEDIGYEDWCLIFGIHYGVGPKNGSVICPQRTYKKPCPICEEKERQKAAGADAKTLGQLNASLRVAYNVVPKDLKDVRLFITSYANFHREMKDKLQVLSDPTKGTIVPADLDEGATVKFRGSKKFFAGKEFLEFKDFEFIDRDPIDEEILDRAIPLEKLMNVLSYEEIEALFFGNEAIVEEEPVEEHNPVETGYTKPEEPKEELKFTPPPEEEAPRRRRRTQEENKCPSGLNFGKDPDTNPVCDDCPEEIYNKCYDMYEQNK